MLIDVHAHLCDEKFADETEAVIADSENENPSRIIDTGSDPITSERAYANALKYRRVFCAVGIHPEFADKLNDDVCARLGEMWANEKVVAIGETGLDYHYDNNPLPEVQKRAFCTQIELAYSLKAPIVVHIRDAYGDAWDLLNENSSKLHYGLLIHCYSGSKEMAARFSKFDSYFSFGGAVTFKNAKEKPAIISSLPLNRILVETDCPYMSPEPFRGRMNFPKNLRIVAEKIAEIIGKDIKEIEEITTENAFRLFKKLK